MLFLGGTPNAAARRFIGFQQQRDVTPRMTRPQNVKAIRQAQQVATAKSDAFLEDDMTQTNLSLKTSLIEDCMKLFKAAAHGNDTSNLSNVISDFISNPMYDDLHSMWDPTELIIEDPEEDLGQYGGAKYFTVKKSLQLIFAAQSIYTLISGADPSTIVGLKTLLKQAGLYLIQLPNEYYDKTLQDLNMNIFMVLLAEGGDKDITDNTVRKVGILLSKKEIKEIKANFLEQKMLDEFDKRTILVL